MKRALFIAAGMLALGGTLAVAPGCTSVRTWFLRGNVISYEQYLSVDQSARPAPTADLLLKTLGTPQAVHDRDGVRRSIDYWAYSLTGDLKTAVFTFDKDERLQKKELW